MNKQLRWRYGLLLIPLVFLGLFFFYPLLAILNKSLASEGQLDLSSLAALLESNLFWSRLWFTTWQAALSTMLTLALALPGAYIFTRYTFPGKSLLMSLSTLPFVLPTVVVAVAFTALIGPHGLLNTGLMGLFALQEPPIQLEHTLTIILIVHVFYNYSVALRIITSFWTNQNPRIEEAARLLGCQEWQLWWEIRLPILFPALLAAAALVFIFTFTSFGVVLILGGLKFATLEVEIYQQAVNLFNLPVAAALSLVQIGVMFLMMVVYTRLQSRITSDLQSAQHIVRSPRNRREWATVLSNLTVMIVLLFAPLLALVIRSFTAGGDGFTTQYYAQLNINTRDSVLFVPPIQAIGNSVFFALLTTLAAVTFGLITAYLLAQRYSRLATWLDPLFMLPLATSAVTLGFGFILSMDFDGMREWLNQVVAFLGLSIAGNWDLRRSWLLIPIAHTLVAMPFVVRSVLPALRGINPTIQEAARVLGASPWQVWQHINLPLISRGIVVGATFAFTISMGEFGASVFIARPNMPTMPVVIFRLLGQPGITHYGQALAMSVLLMAVCAVSFVLIERFRAVGIGEF